MPYATVIDVEVLWGSVFPVSEQPKIEALLAYSSAYLDKMTGPNVNLELLDDALPRYVVIQMVLRVLRNPAGIKQAVTGPTSVTYDMAQSIGRIVVLDEELALLGVELVPPVRNAAIGTFRIMDGWE